MKSITTQFGSFALSFSYDEESAKPLAAKLMEEAIANAVKSAICAAKKGIREEIADREAASEEEILARFPAIARAVKVSEPKLAPWVSATAEKERATKRLAIEGLRAAGILDAEGYAKAIALLED